MNLQATITKERREDNWVITITDSDNLDKCPSSYIEGVSRYASKPFLWEARYTAKKLMRKMNRLHKSRESYKKKTIVVQP